MSWRMPPTLEPKPAALAAAKPLPTRPGSVDFLSPCPKLGGWLLGGWLALSWGEAADAPEATLELSDASCSGAALLGLFPREDVRAFGTGFVLFLPEGEASPGGELRALHLRAPGRAVRLTPTPQLLRLSEADAVARVRLQLGQAPRSAQRTALLALFARPVFKGEDTLAALPCPVFIETDAAILCPPGGLVVRGWFADPFRQVAAIHVRSGGRRVRLDLDQAIAIARPDARESLARAHPDIPERCGFMAFLPGLAALGEPYVYEIETLSGAVGFKRLPPVRSPGLTAIREVLSVFDLRYQEMVAGFDRVAGPAVAAMNAFRLAPPPQVRELAFGTPPAAPACSIVVPLYGRIDFMEYQLADFARTLPAEYELIYVLDDPPRLRAAEALAAACLARFGRPFRLVCPDRNMGYAPANNIGLAHATAPYVCFLNSDVFPLAPDWLDSMLATAAADAAIGIVGALLLFEDGTVQHEGCAYETLAEFGGWRFPRHPNKGRLPEGAPCVVPVQAVTGACMVMRTELARRLGGFDEGYVIGDFEDADLCCKVQEAGLSCVVDRRARLYHLERQSQGGQHAQARLNLTLYNAWRFQSRWPQPGQVAAG